MKRLRFGYVGLHTVSQSSIKISSNLLEIFMSSLPKKSPAYFTGQRLTAVSEETTSHSGTVCGRQIHCSFARLLATIRFNSRPLKALKRANMDVNFLNVT